MRKRVKRLNLNTTKRSHDKLLIKNLFTSFILYGKVVTTETKARALKSYIQSQIHDYASITESRLQKRWINENISTEKLLKKAIASLEKFKENKKISMTRISSRKGDNAERFEITVINLVPTVSNEQDNNAKK